MFTTKPSLEPTSPAGQTPLSIRQLAKAALTKIREDQQNRWMFRSASESRLHDVASLDKILNDEKKTDKEIIEAFEVISKRIVEKEEFGFFGASGSSFLKITEGFIKNAKLLLENQLKAPTSQLPLPRVAAGAGAAGSGQVEEKWDYSKWKNDLCEKLLAKDGYTFSWIASLVDINVDREPKLNKLPRKDLILEISVEFLKKAFEKDKGKFKKFYQEITSWIVDKSYASKEDLHYGPLRLLIKLKNRIDAKEFQKLQIKTPSDFLNEKKQTVLTHYPMREPKDLEGKNGWKVNIYCVMTGSDGNGFVLDDVLPSDTLGGLKKEILKHSKLPLEYQNLYLIIGEDTFFLEGDDSQQLGELLKGFDDLEQEISIKVKLRKELPLDFYSPKKKEIVSLPKVTHQMRESKDLKGKEGWKINTYFVIDQGTIDFILDGVLPSDTLGDLKKEISKYSEMLQEHQKLYLVIGEKTFLLNEKDGLQLGELLSLAVDSSQKPVINIKVGIQQRGSAFDFRQIEEDLPADKSLR